MTMNVISSVDVAILTLLNRLSERYGLSPADAHANSDGEKVFFLGGPSDESKQEGFDRMMAALGLTEETSYVFPTIDGKKILDTINAALKLAPRQRTRSS
jgi:hypothetical protein